MKTKFLVVVLILSLLLVACSTSGQGNNAQAAVSQSSQSGASTNAIQPSASEASQRELPVTMKLALGTFKLDETDYPISADQAKELLPLWKALRTLSKSETAATTEVEAVQRQLQSTMTPEQLKAINDMGLTFQDMRTIAEKLGLDLGFGGGFGNMSPELRATAQAARQSEQGGPPGGGGPGGEFFGPPGGGQFGSDQEARQTAMAQFSNQSGANVGINSALLDAIIEFLTAKTK